MRLLFFLLLLSTLSYSQKVDTVITTKIFTSYYSFKLKDPIFVKYKLYKAGGKVSRGGMQFSTGGLYPSATPQDYYRSGYDRGHLANFEDFSYEYSIGESTFRYYNVIPQTPVLNRGLWKIYEKKIRGISQTDSLLILTGGNGWSKFIGDSVYVPDYCWKIVYSLSKKKVLFIIYVKNDKSPVEIVIKTIPELDDKLGFKIESYLN